MEREVILTVIENHNRQVFIEFQKMVKVYSEKGSIGAIDEQECFRQIGVCCSQAKEELIILTKS